MSSAVRCCCIKSCENSNGSSECAFFVIRKEWIRELNKVRPFDDIKPGHLICELHFNKNDLLSTSRKASKKLKEGIIGPSIFNATPTTSTCSNCVALSVKNQKLEADNERLLKQLSETQAELRCLREKQSVEVGRADQERMAVPEIVIKMEPMPEIDEELRFQDDLFDIKPDPLDAELQMEVAYISSVASAARSIESDISEPVVLEPRAHNRVSRTSRSESKFACDICGKEFRTKHNLAQHKYVHGEKNFKCAQCPYASKFPNVLRAHERNVHSMELKQNDGMKPDWFECYICQQQFEYLKSLRYHMTTMHPMGKCIMSTEGVSISDLPYPCNGQSQVTCEYCTNSFDSLVALDAHLKNDHTESEKLAHVCDICQRQFPMRTLLKIHRKDTHFACFLCNEIFHTAMELKAHERVAYKAKPKYICEVCGKEFRAKHNLIQHRFFHGEAKFKCRQCSFASKFPNILRAHERNVHNMEVKENDGTEPESFECYICKQKFKHLKSIRVHLTRVHPVKCDQEVSYSDTTQLCIGERSPTISTSFDPLCTKPERLAYACDICRHPYNTQEILEAHRKAIHFACSICNEVFATPLELIAHKSDSHAGEKMGFICEECGKEFQTRKHLLQHKYVHGKAEKCTKCSYSTKFPNIMQSHMRNAHGMAQVFKPTKLSKSHKTNKPTTEKGPEPYQVQCFVCKIKLNAVSTLRRHLHRKHPVARCQICDEELLLGIGAHDCLGGQPLHCEYCARSFESLPWLMAHFSTDHADTEKRTYVCDICRRKFHMRSLLDAHRGKHTRGSFACTKCPEVFDKKLELLAHFRRAHAEPTHLCDECGKGFTTNTSLRHHQYSHAAPSVKCPECPFRSTPRLIKAHTKRMHSGGRSFTCYICNKIFEKPHQLHKHSKIHTRRTDVDYFDIMTGQLT